MILPTNLGDQEMRKASIRAINTDAIRAFAYHMMQDDKFVNQVKGALRRFDSYCAEGALCEISGIGKWRGDIRNHFFSYVADPLDMASATAPPTEVYNAFFGIPLECEDWEMAYIRADFEEALTKVVKKSLPNIYGNMSLFYLNDTLDMPISMIAQFVLRAADELDKRKAELIQSVSVENEDEAAFFDMESGGA